MISKNTEWMNFQLFIFIDLRGQNNNFNSNQPIHQQPWVPGIENRQEIQY